MNLLPDIIVLDFCEWLKSSVISDSQDFDLLDLLIDEKYRCQLNNYAEDFLYQYTPSIKGILHQYIESEYFDESFKCCTNYLNRRNIYNLYFPYDEGMIHHYFHTGEFDRSLARYIKDTYKDLGASLNHKKIPPYRLAESASHLFANAIRDDRSSIISFMNNIELNLDLEIDFLEWLINNNSKYIDIHKMPLKTFETVVDKFLLDCDKSNKDKQKLIKSFKQTDFEILLQKLTSALSTKKFNKKKNLKYIIERYQNKNIHFKCVIIPREADAKEYRELIERRWIDLHYLSGDYLDIYYTETDYGKSGYEIMHRLKFIPDKFKTQAPIIVIWENNLQEAKCIDICRLNTEDIFEVIQCIVNLIRDGLPIETIVEEANNMGKELREEKRVIRKNTVNITGGTVNGNVTAENKGIMYTVVQDESTSSTLINELEAAKKIIMDFKEIDVLHQERLTEIMDEMKTAIKNNDKDSQEKSKKSFKDALFFMGNLGSKLITALSGLVNILKFFNISPL